MTRPFSQYRPDPSARDAAHIRTTRERAKMVEAMCKTQGAADVKRWLETIQVNSWGSTDRSEALAIIKRELGNDAWRQALDVVVMF